MQSARAIPFDPLVWLPEEWSAFLAERGERAFRAMQVFRWIHKRGIADAAGMSDLGRKLRDVVAQTGLSMPAHVVELGEASDGTRKGLIGFSDNTKVETVLIPPMPDEDDDAEIEAEASGETEPLARVTQCISSQVGCAMGCVFCASGVAGLKRNLRAAEIVAQVLLGRAALHEGQALRNVVLMGMGEPLHNYDQVARALRLLTHPEGIGLSTRRVTVSTSGLVPEIDRLGKEFNGQIQLAVSVHAPTDELRTAIMPINKRYPLAELVAALRRYPLAPRRRITIEYTLIDRVNDDVSHARALAKLLRAVPVKVNLIPMNPVEGSAFQMPERDRVEAFQQTLRATGYSVFVRRQRGDDIDAACGQLVLRGAAPRKRRLPTLLADAPRDPQVHTDV